jgi:hypothetical protein
MPRPTGVLAAVAAALAGVAMLAAGSGARVDGDEIQIGKYKLTFIVP